MTGETTATRTTWQIEYVEGHDIYSFSCVRNVDGWYLHLRDQPGGLINPTWGPRHEPAFSLAGDVARSLFRAVLDHEDDGCWEEEPPIDPVEVLEEALEHERGRVDTFIKLLINEHNAERVKKR